MMFKFSKILILCLGLILFSFKIADTKLEMLCQKWQQIGAKNFGKDYMVIDKSMAEVLSINKDHTFEKELYGQLKFKGEWKFNKEHTILGFATTEMNGQAMSGMAIGEINPTDSIIIVTKDTLIIGELKYYGLKKIYGHDDRYYTKVK